MHWIYGSFSFPIALSAYRSEISQNRMLNDNIVTVCALIYSNLSFVTRQWKCVQRSGESEMEREGERESLGHSALSVYKTYKINLFVKHNSLLWQNQIFL